MNSRSRGSNKKTFPLQTFTFFLPAPPHRKNGYREREFDKIMAGISSAGFTIVDIKMEAVSMHDHGGVFIMALIQPQNKKAAALDLTQDLHEKFRLSHTHSTPDIILEEEE